MAIAIIDYGMGNLDSMARAVSECGGEPLVTSSASVLSSATHIILPGVGSFAEAMRNLAASGLIPAIKEQAGGKFRVPFMGVCLGMQLLAGCGFEGGETPGLGLIPGSVVRLEPSADLERIPHVGWNELEIVRPSPLFAGIDDRKDFYFVHSYHFVCAPEFVLATTPYCGKINSVVANGNVFGVQFHPEKSQRSGLRLLKNFLAMN